MNYYINDTVRLRLFFDTPNELAVALVMLWGAVLCYLSCCNDWDSDDIKIISLEKIARSLCHLAIVIVPLVCLFATYSRSGMVAFLGVTCVLWWSRGARKWIVISLIVCALCLVFMPNAGERFARIEPVSDKSIANRFDVWRGTLAMSLEKPWAGHGHGGFGEMLTTWYLPVNGSNASYMTAVNTPLTVLGFFGYPALFAYLFLWVILLIIGFRGFCHGKRGVAACFIIQLAFLIGGLFADLHQSWILDCVLLASIGGTVFFHLKNASGWKPFYKRWGVVSSTASAVTCGLMASAGSLLFSEGYSLQGHTLAAHGESTGHGWTLVPKKPNGGRLAWITSHDKVREHARSLCRPLAGQGWEVVMLEPGEGELLAPEVSVAFLQYAAASFPTADTHCFVGGLGEEGLAALALASKLSQGGEPSCKTVLVNIESYWPFEEYNPQATIKAAGGPVTLAYQNGNAHYSQAARALADMGLKAGRRVDLHPLDASGEKDMLVALRAQFFENISIQAMPCAASGIPGARKH